MSLLGWETVGRDDPDYTACVVVTSAAGSIVGGATGSFLGPVGTVGGYAGGGAWGFAIGYLACPYLVPAVKRKIESGLQLSDTEVRSAAEAMGRYAQVTKASDALRLVSFVKSLPPTSNASSTCTNPSLVAKQMLRRA